MNNETKNTVVGFIGGVLLTVGGFVAVPENAGIPEASQAWRPVESSTVFYFTRQGENLNYVGFLTRDEEELGRDPEELLQEYKDRIIYEEDSI